MAQLLATANGEVAFIRAGGNASELAVVLSNLDLARAAQLLLTGDAKAPVHCPVANLAAANGAMAVKTLVVDTSAEKITGSGADGRCQRARTDQRQTRARRAPEQLKRTPR